MAFKIAVAQMHPVVGAIRRNVGQMLEYLQVARTQGAEIVVFPELITSGYIFGDRWEHDAFIQEIEMFDEEIRSASGGLVVVWGSIKADWSKVGEDALRVRKYNAARIAQNGNWASNGVLDGWIPKTNLPKYGIFDDGRHFYAGDKLAAEEGYTPEEFHRPFSVMVRGRKFKLALAICEDIWEDSYHTKISRIYGAHGADLLIDISASPWTAEKVHAREHMLRSRVKDSGLPILYVNTVGLENNTKNLIWFDGNSAFINRRGKFTWRAPQNEEGLFLLPFGRGAKLPPLPKQLSGMAEIHRAIICAMREFYKPFERVVIGLSGGIDSAVSLALHVEALGPEKVVAVNMPSKNNSATTQRLAEQCAKANAVAYHVVPIQNLVDERSNVLVAAGFATPTGLALENIQARERGAGMLAAIAQMLGGVFTNNGNKTEMALNYFTLYGDGAGCAAFLGDLWKEQVYRLARYMNKRAGREVVPQEIIALVPSAELSPEQNVDEGKGDPIFYPYHDYLLRAFVETRWDPTVVIKHALLGDLEKRLGCKRGTINKYFPTRAAFVENLEWAWKQFMLDFKRPQTPMVFTTSRRSFGSDYRATIADSYLTGQYKADRARYLSRKVRYR